MLCEEVTVNNLNQAGELLDRQQARRDIQDEFREHFAELLGIKHQLHIIDDRRQVLQGCPLQTRKRVGEQNSGRQILT